MGRNVDQNSARAQRLGPGAQIGTTVALAIDFLSTALGWAAMTILVAMVTLVTYDVVARYLFGNPLTGSADITQQMFAVMLFIGLGYSTRHHSHIRMTILVKRISPVWQRRLNLVTDLVGIVVVAFFTREMFLLAMRSLERDENIPYAPFFFPAFWPQLLILIGLTLFGLQLIVETFRQYRGR